MAHTSIHAPHHVNADGTRHSNTPEVPSHASVLGHPVHPALIPYPIAFLTTAFATDVLYARTRNPFWARSTKLLLQGGLVSGALAGVVGAIDYLSIPKVTSHPVAKAHALGNVTALLLTLLNLAGRTARHPQPRGTKLSALVAATLFVTGALGAELSYRHKVGVNSAPPGTLSE